MRILDNRGLSCPEPVINTKRALEQQNGAPLVSIVDNEVSKSNVLKFARSQGYRTVVRQEGTSYYITIGQDGPDEMQADAPAQETKPSPHTSVLYLITGEEVGRGSGELGRALQKTFLYALAETGQQALHIVFIHGGAHLTCEGSPVLISLERLKSLGWSIATCGACLDYYSLKDKLAIGEVTNMYAIVELMRSAAKVITI